MKRFPMPLHNRFLHFRSLRTTLLFSFSVLIIVTLSIFFVSSLNYTEEAIVENSTNYTLQLIEQVNTDIDSYIQYMENISQLVTLNMDVREYLFSTNKSEEQLMDLQDRVTSQFAIITESRADIYNIAVLSKNGRHVINSGRDELNENIDLTATTWYQESIAMLGSPVLSSSHVQTIIKNDYQWVITLSKAMKNPYTAKQDGFFFIDLNYSAIRSLCENISLGSKGYVFILDADGNIIYHPQQQLLYFGLKEERTQDIDNLSSTENSFITDEGNASKLYTISTSPKTGWTVVGVAHMSELLIKKQETQRLYLVISVLLFIAALLISVLISDAITRPLKVLRNSMKSVEKGNFDNVYIPVSGENELSSLSNSFNIMTTEIQHLMKQNMEEQRQKRKSELMALQSQINPHFLYNTLDSIIWMAEIGKSKEVVLMTSSLARLLRQSISNNDELVTIEKEINYTKTYLTIQKMRYKDQLEFEIDLDPQIFHIKIIKLILQPLVENALYHGIKYKDEKGLISIFGTLSTKYIFLTVKDNGVGMSSDQLAHIFDEKEVTIKSNGVAINNVQRRIQLYYGLEYGLIYESQPNIGTSVTISLPRPKGDFLNENEI